MTMVWHSLKNETDMSQARGGNENLSSSAGVLHKTSNLAISRCCFADDGKEMEKERAKLLFCLLNMQICNVFVRPSLLVNLGTVS